MPVSVMIELYLKTTKFEYDVDHQPELSHCGTKKRNCISCLDLLAGRDRAKYIVI